MGLLDPEKDKALLWMAAASGTDSVNCLISMELRMSQSNWSQATRLRLSILKWWRVNSPPF